MYSITGFFKADDSEKFQLLQKLNNVANKMNELALCRRFRKNNNKVIDEAEWDNDNVDDLMSDEGYLEEPPEVDYCSDDWTKFDETGNDELKINDAKYYCDSYHVRLEELYKYRDLLSMLMVDDKKEKMMRRKGNDISHDVVDAPEDFDPTLTKDIHNPFKTERDYSDPFHPETN